MAKLLSNLVPYVSPTLVRAVLADPRCPARPVAERFPAAVFFADISGFTPLTEALGRRGAEGPEEMTRLLNHYFSRMIAIVESEGGEVIRFSGDAMAVLFPARDEPLSLATRRALQSAQAMQAAMLEFAAMPTSAGPVALRMKVGIGAGEVLAMQVGGVGDRWEYVVGGAPLRQATAAQGHARRGEIVLSPEAEEVIYGEPLAARPIAQADWGSIFHQEALEVRLRHFVPEVVLGWLEEGLRDWLAVLRPMSVLFVGVDGLDYAREETVEQLHRFLRRAQETVARYEGSINKLTVDDKGTVLLVLFGAPPYAHEDDPLRATRCALDLQALVGKEPPLRLFIGLTTGRVFAGPVGSETRREYTVMGDTVNLAARLMGAVQGLGRDGERAILSDFGTYSQAQGQVAFESLAPVRVKGKAGLIRVYRPQAAAGNLLPASRDLVPLVGRQAERARLEAALEAVQAGQGRILLIEGEPGIGKSRLVAELTGLLRERGLAWLLGSAQSTEQQTPYRAWRDVLTYYFGLTEADDLPTRQAHVQTLVQEVAPDQLPRLPLLNDILSLNLPETNLTASLDPALRQQSLFLLLVTLLRAWARDRPLVLVLEDAHWLDSLSWDLAVYAARALTAAGDPVLLVLAMRPVDKLSVAAQHVAVLQTFAMSETIALTTLQPEETVVLVTHRLGLAEGGLPEALAELVRQRSEGNPFFAEELVFTLRDQGLIRLESNPPRCVVSGDLAQTSQSLPGTIQGLILARIDRLPPERQLTLKVAAVIGRTFAYGALRYTLGCCTTIGDAVLKSHLDSLSSLGLTPLYTPEPDLSYTFKHIITQEVAYETLLFAQRRQLHRTVAQWYEESFGGTGEQTLGSYYPLLAHHYHQAQDQERERLYARLAGEQAAARFANAEAVAYFSRALELTPAAEEAGRYNLLLAREKVYDLQGARAAQDQDLLALQELAEQLDDDQKRAEVLLGRARYAESTGNFQGAIAAAQEAIDLARRAQAVGVEAGGYLYWGRALWRQGEYEAAQAQLERSLALSLAAQLPRQEEDCLRNLGIVSAEQGDGPGARAHFERALAISRQIGDRRGESATLNNLGIIAHRMGDSAGFASYSRQALHTYSEIGDRRGQGWALNNLGVASERQGNDAAARDHYEQALRIFREIGDQMGEGAALNNLGVVSHRLGDYAESQSYYEQAVRICREIGDRQGEGEGLAYLGLLTGHRGDYEAAGRISQEALEIARELGDGAIEGHALTALGHALAGQGLLDQAAAAYRQAAEVRRAQGEHTAALESLAGLGSVTLAQGQAGQALALVEEVVAHLAAEPLVGTSESFWVYLVCYRILRANADPRARPLLQTAHRLLQEQAGRIDDERLRHTFLEGIAAHREIEGEVVARA